MRSNDVAVANIANAKNDIVHQLHYLPVKRRKKNSTFRIITNNNPIFLVNVAQKLTAIIIIPLKITIAPFNENSMNI